MAAAEAKAEAEAAPSDDARKLDQATALKEKGAEVYKQQQFEEARKLWQEAIEVLESSPEINLRWLRVSLMLNLAQVGLQLKDYDDVLKQTTAVIALDQDNAKAYFRRGVAQDALGKLQAAVLDFQKAARIEPRNGDIRKRYEEQKRKVQDVEHQQEKAEGPPNHDLRTLPKVFLDIAVGAQPPQRLVFALYADTTPKTAENFRQLCTGEHAGRSARGKAFHYKGSVLHRMIPSLMVQGGDFESSNGTGGESIYSRRFEDENFRDKPSRRGLLAMANDGPNTNGSNFFVLFAPAEHLERHHVVFGELLEGWTLLDSLEKLSTDECMRPLEDCVVVDCGELRPATSN